MKTTILHVCSSFPVKNKKKFYDDKMIKKIKITVELRKCSKRSF